MELHLASVKLLETSDEEDTTTGDYYVRSRRFEVLRCLRRDSWPSHDAGGGFFFDFELFRTASRPSRRVRGTAVFTRQRRRDAIVVIPRESPWSSGRRRRDATSDRDAPRRCASCWPGRGTCLRPNEGGSTDGPTRSIKAGSRTSTCGGGSASRASRPKFAWNWWMRLVTVLWALIGLVFWICSKNKLISVHWIT